MVNMQIYIMENKKKIIIVGQHSSAMVISEKFIRENCSNIVVENKATMENENELDNVETIETYMGRRISEGYITEDGKPIKCECGNTDFKMIDPSYGAGYVEEYSLECKKEGCGKIVGHWAYGNWSIC